MTCDCKVKDTTFINELSATFDSSTPLQYDIETLIPEFDPKYSGIWQPVLYGEPAKNPDNKQWIKVGTQASDCESTTPDGLGIKSFVLIDNPKFKNWTITGKLQLSVDWLINLNKYYDCKTYTSGVLFWYRYYNMDRPKEKDLRMFPGIDLYISDGDMAIIEDGPIVTPNISGSFLTIKSSLINAGYNSSEASINAAILSTGPQIDRITEILSGPDNGLNYERTSLGLLYPQLSGMSNKRYSDIGQGNFITNKIQLLKKISSKYGIQLIVPEASEATLKSNFQSVTGPNIEIQMKTDLLFSDEEQSTGYDISVYLNDQNKLEAVRSDEIFTVQEPPAEEGENPTETKYNINYVKYGNETIGYNLSEQTSGIFNPNFNMIKLHGLGGIDFTTSLSRDTSCSSAINGESFDGPYFVQKTTSPQKLDGTPSNIFIKVKTHNNSQVQFSSGIFISYLRSDSKPSCTPFINENSSTCKCFSLMDLHPEASGQQELSNESATIYVPSTSMFYLPSGQYYGGLTQNQVNSYGLILPSGHPNPGTPLPKTHQPIFPMDKNCSYRIEGCGNKNINLNFDYPAELIMNYESTNAHFKLSWNDNYKKNEDPYFTNVAGSLCLTKKTQNPTEVSIEISVPPTGEGIEWAIELSGVQLDYPRKSILAGLDVSGTKGFFHPNFGWTYETKYHNLSPIIPIHNGLSIPTPYLAGGGSYTLYVRYSNTDGPCPGGHGCDRAKFNVYVNDVFIGIANLNNGGGPDDPGTVPGGDRTAVLTLPKKVRNKSGKTMDIFIQCAYEGSCHGGIAWTQIIDDKGQKIFDSCIGTEVLVTIELEESLNNYFYNAKAMYKEQYLPGYNFIYSTSGMTEQQKNKIDNSTYLGIKTDGGSYYVNNNFTKTKYNPIESMILENIPFEYINIDYAYGYAYNDFKYTREAETDILEIDSSSNNSFRVLNYIDDPFVRQEEITVVSAIDSSKKENVFITEILDTNKFRINKTLDDKLYLRGYLYKTLKNGQYNQSIIIYRPNETYLDEKLTISKWGNLSYGYAAQLAKKYDGIAIYQQDLFLNQEWYGQPIDNIWYNNSTIRTSVTENTSFSWGCPISFVNNYDIANQTYFFPTTRLFDTLDDSNRRKFQILNYEQNLEIANDLYLPGDSIISQGSINNTNGWIYIGSITGPLTIKVKLNTKARNSGLLIFKHNNKEIFRGKAEDVNENDEIIITYNKNDILPIYGELIAQGNSDFCIPINVVLDAASSAKAFYIKDYTVSLDNVDPTQLSNRSRISYYKHEPSPSLLGQKKTEAINDSSDFLLMKESHIRSLNKDFNPFMDLNIFESDDSKKPILSNSGIIYFEDFFKPKSYNYLYKEMEVPYNDDLYWIDIQINDQWNLLTSKNILLTNNTKYKIPKKIEYKCAGDTDTCSDRYPTNICEESYEITKGDIYDILGLIGADQQLLDITEISFPEQCDAINYCCKTEEECSSEDCDAYEDQADIDACLQRRENCLSDREDCLEKQNTEIEECKDFWFKDSKKDVSCKDICPTGNLSGTIEFKSLEYYVIELKKDIKPNLQPVKEITFTFLPQSDSIDIPCTNLSFPNIGETFLYNYSCADTNKECSTIIPQDYSAGSKYIPGVLVDLSVLKNNKISAELNIVPSSVIIENELRYRNSVDHPNVISAPLYEYDPDSGSKYVINHTFDIKSKKCIGPGKLFTLSLDNLTCDFTLSDTASGLILESSCFNDVVIDPKTESYLTVYKTICEGEFKCASDLQEPCNAGVDCQPYGCEEWSCEDAAEYLKSISSDYELIKCEEISLPEDYYLSCRQCGDINCSASIYYSDPLPRECYCPPGSKLIGDPGQETCEYEYDILTLNPGDGDAYKDYVSDACDPITKTVKAYAAPSCFGEVVGPSKEALDQYNNSCPKSTEFVSQSSSDQIIYIDDNGTNSKYNELVFKSTTEYYRMICELNQAREAYAKCLSSCEGSAACCACYATYWNATNDIASSETVYYNCNSYCNTSDYITIGNANSIGGACYDGQCYITSTSAGGGCSPESCCPDTGCDYNSCAEIGKRLKVKHWSWTASCDGDGNFKTSNGYCEDLSLEQVHTVASSYQIKTREVKSYYKYKTYVSSQQDKIDSTSTVKVFNKEFKLTFKNQDDSGCSECADDEICCENQCISEDEECCEDKTDLNIQLSFEIYDNVIIGMINDDEYNKIYRTRSSSFKCPKINFKSENEQLYICHNVTSECIDCFAGAKNV